MKTSSRSVVGGIAMITASTSAVAQPRRSETLRFVVESEPPTLMRGVCWTANPTAAHFAFNASSTRSFRSFTSTSVEPPTLMTANPPANFARRSCNFSRSCLVAGLYLRRDDLPLFVAGTGTDDDDPHLGRLFPSGVRDDDAARGLFLGGLF
jgi:hypothetical protein